MTFKCSHCKYTSHTNFTLSRHIAKCRFRQISSSTRSKSTNPAVLALLHDTNPSGPDHSTNIHMDPIQTPDENSAFKDRTIDEATLLVNRFATFLHNLSIKVGSKTIKELIGFLRDPLFQIDIFRTMIKTFADWTSR